MKCGLPIILQVEFVGDMNAHNAKVLVWSKWRCKQIIKLLLIKNAWGKLCGTNKYQDQRSATYAQGKMKIMLHGCA